MGTPSKTKEPFKTHGQMWFAFYRMLSTTNFVQDAEQRFLHAKQGKRRKLSETYIRNATPQKHDWNTRRMPIRELYRLIPPGELVVHVKTSFSTMVHRIINVLGPLNLSFQTQVELNKMGPAIELLLIDLGGKQSAVLTELGREQSFTTTEAVIVPHGDDIISIQWNLPIWFKTE